MSPKLPTFPNVHILARHFLSDAVRVTGIRTDFLKIIKGTTSRCAQGGGNEKWMKSVLYVFFHGLSEDVSPEAAVLIRLQDAQLNKSNHGCLFHTRMSFFGTIGHQLGEESCLFKLIAIFHLQCTNGLGPSGEQTIQDAFTG